VSSIDASASTPINRAFGRFFRISAASAPEPVPRSTTAGDFGAAASTASAAASINAL
jgi:hypothetical protein